MSERRTRVRIATLSALADGRPAHARAAGVDLVVIRRGEEVTVLYGRCPHRGAPLWEGTIEGPDLVCRAHGWDFRIDTGESPSIDGEQLGCFAAEIDAAGDAVWLDEAQLVTWKRMHPRALDDDEFLD